MTSGEFIGDSDLCLLKTESVSKPYIMSTPYWGSSYVLRTDVLKLSDRTDDSLVKLFTNLS